MLEFLIHLAWAFLFVKVSSLAQTSSFSSLNDCPKSCVCFYDPKSHDVVTKCMKLALTSIPENISNETTVLDVSNSALTHLRRSDLNQLGRLQHICLAFNRDFSTIEEGAFGNSSNLKKVEVYGNNLQNLDGAFLGVSSANDVTELNIHSNPNLRLSRGFLALFRSLEVLNVANTTFQYNEDLFWKLSLGKYESLDKLIYLNIESKQIRSLGAAVLQHTPNVKVIHVGFNEITEVDAFMFAKNLLLEEIYLNWNRVTNVDVSAFSNQQKLRYLDLTGNYLVTITMGTFDLMPPVSGVCLSWNPLSCDCNAQWLSSWMNQFGRTNCIPHSFTQCSGTHQERGMVLADISEEMFCDEQTTTNLPAVLIGVLVTVVVFTLICVVVFFIIVGLFHSRAKHGPGRPRVSTIQLRRMSSNSTSALI